MSVSVGGAFTSGWTIDFRDDRMVQQLNRIMGRVDLRVLSILMLLAVFATIGWTYAQFADDSNTVDSYEDLIARYLDDRESSYRLAVPAWYMEGDHVESIESTYGLAGFQNQSDWYVGFDVG